MKRVFYFKINIDKIYQQHAKHIIYDVRHLGNAFKSKTLRSYNSKIYIVVHVKKSSIFKLAFSILKLTYIYIYVFKRFYFKH